MIDGRTIQRYSFNVPLDVKFDDQFLDYVICGAFEGGSNYWINWVDIQNPNGERPKDTPKSEWAFDALKCGGTITIHTSESDDNESVTIDLTDLIAGVRLYVRDMNERFVYNDDGEILTVDLSNRDCNDDDMILQYAAFGEVIYG